MPPQMRQTHKNASERDNSSSSKAPVDNQYVTLDTFNDMVKEIWSIQSLIQEQAVSKLIHNIENVKRWVERIVSCIYILSSM